MIRNQEKLVNQLFTYTLTDLPSTIWLQGDIGCGKHTLINDLAQKHEVQIEDVSTKLSFDNIMEMYSNPNMIFYIIDFITIDTKKSNSIQNSILKFIEEPPENARLFILTELNSYVNLLPTIQNRCQRFIFDPYTQEFLVEFAKEHDIPQEIVALASRCNYNTPGRILTLQNTRVEDLQEIQSLVDKIIDNINRANVSNTLTLTKYVHFKDDDSGLYNMNLFLCVLENTYVDRAINNTYNFNVCLKCYGIIQKYKSYISVSNVNKKALFENMLLELKGVA